MELYQLKNLIKQNIDAITMGGGKYVITDLPYHTNIGDTLIWEGTRTYLTSRKDLKCLGRTSS